MNAQCVRKSSRSTEVGGRCRNPKPNSYLELYAKVLLLAPWRISGGWRFLSSTSSCLLGVIHVVAWNERGFVKMFYSNHLRYLVKNKVPIRQAKAKAIIHEACKMDAKPISLGYLCPSLLRPNFRDYCPNAILLSMPGVAVPVAITPVFPMIQKISRTPIQHISAATKPNQTKCKRQYQH